MNKKWRLVNNNKWGLMHTKDGMEALRKYFQDGVNEMNIVLFSTSGISGTYNTIEDAEKGGGNSFNEVTFLILQPRRQVIFSGNCIPKTPEDFQFLKKLRSDSKKAILTIGEEE